MENSRTIGFIGIGIFLYLTLQGISSLFDEIIRSSFLFFDIHPFILLTFSEFFSLILVIVLFSLLISKVKKIEVERINIRKTFLISVGAYFITQLLGFVCPLIFGVFETIDNIDRSLAYHKALRDNGYLNIVITISSWILRYIIIAFIILKVMRIDDLYYKD